MRKKIQTLSCLFLLMIVVNVNKTIAQTNADSIYYKRLYYLCKTWGYVKYYHTETAKGLVNWDQELINAVDGVKNASNNSEYNNVLESMIHNAGDMGTGSTPLPNVYDSLNNNCDMIWVDNPILTESVRGLINDIKQKFRPHSIVYVDEAYPNGNPTFKTDTLYYKETIYPSEEKRLLALFRYWNTIYYFFPYKKIMDQDWDTTLVEFIPHIIKVSDALSYNLVFKELTTRINDSHAAFSSSTFWDWEGRDFPPFLIRYIENETVVTKVLADAQGVSVGDIIKEIDGHDIYKLRDSLKRYVHGSNSAVIERNLNYSVYYGDAGAFEIKLDNGSEVYTKTLTRNEGNFDLLYQDSSPIWKIVTANNSCSVGLVDMGRLEKAHVQQMFDDLWNTDAIIFDLRNYPNQTLWNIVNYLFSGPINIANFTIPDIKYPGRLFWNRENIGGSGANTYSGKIVILFDERTQSQAEYTCMGLEQFPNAIKIGSTTAGADGNVSYIYLPGKIVTAATFLGTYYPDYTPTQRIGIVPDFEVKPTIQGIKNGQDELVDYALDYLNCIVNGTSEQIADNGIMVCPNPVQDYLKYQLPENKNDISFEFFDVMGRKVKEIAKISNSGEIDVSGFEPGIYIVKITTDNKAVTKKILKD